MSIEFSTKISALRREKNLSQKEAAEALGISQALLSHYEKGIRECNLDFVRKAAEYYEVTSDYILGLSDTRQGLNEIFEGYPLQSDAQMKAKTILRCMLYLSQETETHGESAEMFFSDYFAMSIRKYLSITYAESAPCDFDKLCDFVISKLIAHKYSDEMKPLDRDSLPLCIDTLIKHCTMLTGKSISETAEK